jgi:uncharacterized protein (TIGR02646 family)
MVRTPRPPAPAELVRNAGKWTQRWIDIRAGSEHRDWATLGAKRAIQPVLREMAHGKCAYCEGVLETTGDLLIDHYMTKTREPNHAFEWTNLFPACQKCNRAKGDQDHRGRLLKPDSEDPEPCFWLHPDTGRLEPHPTLNPNQRLRAEETIRLCALQRAALCTWRTEMMKRVQRFAETRDFADEEDLLDPRQQFKFVIRFVLIQKHLPDLAERDRERFEGR